MNQIWLALLTGLTTGGISCFVVQGGLLASSLAQRESEKDFFTKKDKFLHIGTFLVFKLTVYTLLGLLLGLLGQSFALSPKIQSGIQIIVAIFLLATFGRLLEIHPVFRHFVIQPPTFVYRLMKKKSLEASLFAPAALGLMTIAIPCGVTQAMMALAVASGNPLSGAAIMFSFVLGTSPIFFALGLTAVEIFRRKTFVYLAGLLILILALISLNSGLKLLGSRFNFNNIYTALTNPSDISLARVVNGVQEVTINVGPRSYSASASTLKIGIPVRLRLVTDNIYSCSRAFTVPEYNLFKILPPTGEEILEFTPTKTGTLIYTCSMGMYSGSFEIVE